MNAEQSWEKISKRQKQSLLSRVGELDDTTDMTYVELLLAKRWNRLGRRIQNRLSRHFARHAVKN